MGLSGNNSGYRTTEGAEDRFLDWLFLETVKDLDVRARAGASRYEKLGIAPLLRKLVLDKHPLVRAVAERHRDVPIAFRFVPFTPAEPDPARDPSIVMMYAYAKADYYAPDAEPSPLKHLLRSPVAVSESGPVTFAEIVQHYSHVEGGVHLVRQPADPLSKLLLTMSGTALDHEDLFVDVLVPLGRVVHDGLQPLVARIKEQRTLPFM